MRRPTHAANRLAANLFFSLHLAFSLFVVFGVFLTVLSRIWLWAHILAVLWTFGMNVADWTCALTTWEQRHRGDQMLSSGFIRHYLGPLLNANGDPRRLEVGIGVAILIWNALLYAVLFSRIL